MAPYRLFKHKDYDRTVANLPTSIRRKALWAQVLLGTRGRTPSVKGTNGFNARWRRTPVQGNHYYMWWIPGSESGLADDPITRQDDHTILVHSIRHHDETDDPISPGRLTDYEEIAIATLDPRYEEQTHVSNQVQHEHIALATIKGLPGSGKTISLLYLARDLAERPDLQHILYITYTRRLKRAAQEFLQAQGDPIYQKIRVATLGEIEQQLTDLPAQQEPFGELPNFLRFLDYQNASALGTWRRYPQTLFTEIRAHLLGRLFPADYALSEAQKTELLIYNAGLDARAYASQRTLELPAAELACRLAERAQENYLFQDQKAAYLAIQRLQKGKSPRWVANLDALVIDEVQDLTLLQIGVLGELVRERMRRRPDAPFAFVVAGDESQIVQPSGFDWGVTKVLLGEQMGTWPDEFEFHYQRRSPRNLAQLIDSTWNFYSNLPRALRPSARRQAFSYETIGADATEEGNGQVFLCRPRHQPGEASTGAKQDWQQLLDELVGKPGRVIVDLSETLRATLETQFQFSDSDEVVFLPREIKGLERTTVLVYGLDALYQRALQLCEARGGDTIPQFEARRLFDEIRVALSRSTERLILLEADDAPVLAALQVAAIPGILTITWPDLVETLQTEDLSVIEVIEGYLDEVDDLWEREMWEQGYRRNRRAYDLAVQIDDYALQREAQEQYIGGYLQETERLLATQQWQAAYAHNRQAAHFAATFGDPLLQEQVDDQLGEVRRAIAAYVTDQLQSMPQQLALRQYRAAYQALPPLRALAQLTDDQALLGQLDEELLRMIWQWTLYLLDQPATTEGTERVAALFQEGADLLARQADGVGAPVLQLLASRYRELAPQPRFTRSQLADLLQRIQAYLALIAPLHLDVDAYRYVSRWLDEAFTHLVRYPALYYEWAVTAQEFAVTNDYLSLDEHLWELENHLVHQQSQGQLTNEENAVKRFQAFIAAYNEAPAEASTLWEELGEMELAIATARTAGDLERAYTLLRQERLPIPEELAVTVKALRLLQQLEQKHQGLLPAERQTLLAELQKVGRAVNQSMPTNGDEVPHEG
ncbi:MAG: AAA family ATPase [Caldilineaceae bacterium]|nr:AAA family ATPase [Caldilineaceae bacterium]